MHSSIWYSESKLYASAKQPKKLKELVREYWIEYCAKSSIHGVRYLCDPSVRYLERIIWSVLVATSVVFTCIACFVLAERYYAQKLETFVEDSQYPVFHIQFPSVGVCTHNRINWNKFEEAKKRFLPPNADANMKQVFTLFVSRLENMRFGRFQSFAEMEDVNLEALDFIDILKLIQFLAPTCQDIFLNGTCTWRKINFDCCELFIMERTEWGYCLVFNSDLSPESQQLKLREGSVFYPYHNSKAGQGTGLNFVLRLDNSMKPPNSTENYVLIMIKKPDQWSDTGYSITPNTESYVIVRPELTDADENLRHLTPIKRNCLFTDEQEHAGFKTLKGTSYRQGNCLNVCHEEHLIKYCNCTLPSFFPTNNNVNACKASDFRCLAKNTEIFSYDKRQEEDAFFSSIKPGMTCFCLVTCRNMQYFTSLTTLPLEDFEKAAEENFSLFVVDVHYQAEVLVKYRTNLEFTSIDFMANFGGIFGLCLGASLVSAVELFYYLTIGFGLYLYDNNYYRSIRIGWQNFRRRLLDKWPQDTIITQVQQQQQQQQYQPRRTNVHSMPHHRRLMNKVHVHHQRRHNAAW